MVGVSADAGPAAAMRTPPVSRTDIAATVTFMTTVPAG
jgi:hypothetical protein